MFLIYSEQETSKIDTTSTPSGEDLFTGNIWTPASLVAIRDIEMPIKNSPEFKKFCLADQDAIIPTSPLAEMSPTYQDVTCVYHSFLSPLDLVYYSGYLPHDIDRISQAELDNVLQNALDDPKVW